MANVLEFATIFQEQLDKQMTAKLTSGWMEANAGMVEYNGGKEIKIPKITTQGLGNYDRGNGFVGGSVKFEYETRTMTQDRGRTFSIDAMDLNETKFKLNATNVMGNFQVTQVVPEVDAYRYSKIASLAIAGNVATPGIAVGGYTPNPVDIYSKLTEDLAHIRDIVGDMDLVITMSAITANILSNSGDISRHLSVTDFKSGEVNTRVKSIDGIPIIEVPSARLKTQYTFNDGVSGGQEAGGFVPAGGAKDINWIIMPRTAPIAVSKTDKIRIFDPQTNQSADAWKLDYRKYHDIWITDEMLKICRVNIKQTL